MMVSRRNLLLQGLIFRFRVKLQGVQTKHYVRFYLVHASKDADRKTPPIFVLSKFETVFFSSSTLPCGSRLYE